jgi:cystathionine gamma-synthase
MMHKDLKPETRAAQAMGDICSVTGAIIPPVHVSTTYARDADYEPVGGRSYIRADNPAFDPAETLLATLEGGAEGGAAAMLFSSGMAAATAVFQCLRPGDRVVAPDSMYFGLPKWLRTFGAEGGLDVTFAPTGDMAALAQAAKGGAKIVWLETPSNPSWLISDIAAAAEIAHGAGARLVVDNTVPTPVLTRPIELGADMVMHSATKSLNGHSDVIAGALVTAREDDFWARLRDHRALTGPLLGSFEAFLLSRGMRTLFLRVRASSAAALTIAQHFENHPAVEAVMYPGLASHPGHEIAARQMTGGFGGVLSIGVRGGATAALEVAKRCELFKRATSLGGVESLIEHRYTVEGDDSDVPENLLRLSIGLEHVDDLIDDLETALDG